MTIREHIKRLEEYADIYGDEMPVCDPDGHIVGLNVVSGSLEWTDGGDPYSYYQLGTYGGVDVLVVR